MGLTSDDYTAQLVALLPPGRAWPGHDSAILVALLRAWADEFARVDGRAEDLMEEADPRTTAELLDEWEAMAGLPDPCWPPAVLTDAQRRTRLAAKLHYLADQTEAGYIALCAELGSAVTIDTFRPLICGRGRAGQVIRGYRCRYVWRVNLAEPVEVTRFRTGVSRCGRRLGTWNRNIYVECVVRRIAHAHTVVIFGYVEAT
jgi:uncharacterized protein YmfQ (DUF2313 family)